jgi:hypothetical protein
MVLMTIKLDFMHSSGDDTSSLDIAQTLRACLIKFHETIDLIRCDQT